MIQAFDNTKLIGHYYEREKGAPLIVFFMDCGGTVIWMACQYIELHKTQLESSTM